MQLLHRFVSDVYMMTDSKFSIKFEYSRFDIENVGDTHKMVWKCCRFHKSLYNCLQHHASLARSTLADDHLSIQSVCRCTNKNNVCVNTVLCKTNELYNPMLNEYQVTLNFENNGLRCLYAAVSFAVGIKSKNLIIQGVPKLRLILGLFSRKNWKL